MNKLKVNSLKNINEIAQKFIKQMGENRIFAFYGKMGAGKTTFIKALCEEFGVKENVNSPTFSIVNEYETATGNIIYHFDCYRINKPQEAINLGFEDYFYSGNICLIEWAENIVEILPENTIEIKINVLENNEREIYIEKPKIHHNKP